ncbi:putative teichuronic acid biosynthesis glycosyltransferase TuaC [subsurface metagenome]
MDYLILRHSPCDILLPYKIRFGFIGPFIEQKGLHILIRAFNKVKVDNVVLKIFGDKPALSRDSYSTKIRSMVRNKNIKFMGRFNNEDIAKILSTIDVLIVPSIWYENSPLVIHEAFMARVPVITANIGGMAELVQNNMNGLLFKVGDAEDLFEKIDRFIKEPRLIEELGKNIPAIKTIEEDANELEGLYTILAHKYQISV